MSIYYITRIIGTGMPHVDPYRPEMNTYTISNSAIIPVYMQVDFDNGTIPAGKKIGDPIFTWCLVVIPTGSNTATIDADIASGATNADRLPITSLDATIGSLTDYPAQHRAEIRRGADRGPDEREHLPRGVGDDWTGARSSLRRLVV
jgi:hypothetical protein